MLPKNYQRPPPLGGKVPEPDPNPLDDQLEGKNIPGKSLTAHVSPRGNNTKANLERRRNQLM